jgi:hypothetical protein
VKVVLRTEDEPLPPIAGADRLIVLDCVARPTSRPARSSLSVLDPGQIIQLTTTADHRALQLLRFAGRGWTLRAAGVADGRAIGQLLTLDESIAFGRLVWLVDVLDLGGTELTRQLTNHVGPAPGGLARSAGHTDPRPPR